MSRKQIGGRCSCNLLPTFFTIGSFLGWNQHGSVDPSRAYCSWISHFPSPMTSGIRVAFWPLVTISRNSSYPVSIYRRPIPNLWILRSGHLIVLLPLLRFRLQHHNALSLPPKRPYLFSLSQMMFVRSPYELLSPWWWWAISRTDQPFRPDGCKWWRAGSGVDPRSKTR